VNGANLPGLLGVVLGAAIACRLGGAGVFGVRFGEHGVCRAGAGGRYRRAGPAYYPKSFPPPAVYDWTGVYLGFHVGGGILTDSVSQNGVSSTSATATSLLSSANLRPAGVLGGAQIGANYEFVPWVVGIEGSWTDSTNSGSTLIACSVCPPLPAPVIQERFTSHALWFAALTGRAGYAANDCLFYAKAGGAWLHVSYTEDLLVGAGVTAASQVLSDNRTGFTAGAGIEFGLVENLSGKIEYDFYGFGSKNYNFNFTPVSVRSQPAHAHGRPQLPLQLVRRPQAIAAESHYPSHYPSKADRGRKPSDVAPGLRPVARVLPPLLRGIAALMRWQKPNVLTMFVETEGSWRVPYALARRAG
jgi:outer membrane immunogenic protein